ncbi:hypothetical protein VKT23_016307 [Stygiomarasmius scandens]|uniref:F-box domain-containing protein n=1 Tax=Marasmiellus scandens TaxID=2682957 RepID=A0ABR1IVE1_9AGAR
MEDATYDIASLLRTIQCGRFSSPLLPNLTALRWDVDQGLLEDVVMFMHPGMRKCEFSTYYEEDLDVKGLHFLIEAISFRMPLLTSLDMDLYPVQDYVGPLSSLCKALPSLKDISLPAFKDVSQIFTSLRSSLELRSLSMNSAVTPPASIAVSSVGGPLGDNAFPLLETVSLSVVKYESLCSFLRTNKLPNLTALTLSTITIEKAESIRKFMSDLAQCCPLLVKLEMGLFFHTEFKQYAKVLPPVERDIITFEDVRPALKCTEITHFSIKHPYPLSLSDPDIEAIASAWSQLEYLHLSHKPLVQSSFDVKKPTFSSIFTLTRRCQNLRILKVVVDTTSGYTFSQSSGTFARLTSLNVGDSPIKSINVYDVAASLERICCSKHALKWDGTFAEHSLDKNGMNWDSRWKMVKNLIPHFSRMQETVRNQRLRMESLEKELAATRDELLKLQKASRIREL